jgi:Leucine-rich repeat (LRR) protein
MKGSAFITLAPVAWLILYSCRAPWNTEPCGHVTRLHVNSCGLEAIDARDFSRLAHLNCAGNKLERLNCSCMENLRSLECSGNDMTTLNVDGCVRLKRLRIGGNPALRENASELLARATGEPKVPRRSRLTSTSLFDL